MTTLFYNKRLRCDEPVKDCLTVKSVGAMNIPCNRRLGNDELVLR